MSYEQRKRRSYAVAAAHLHLIAKLKLPLLVMLPAWVAYFFAVSFFGPSLERITVPYVNLPLGTELVVLGCALAFPILLYLMSRAFVGGRRS